MTAGFSAAQRSLASLLVAAVVFAPAGGDNDTTGVRPADDLVQARVLAPTLDQAIRSTDRKHSAWLGGADQRFRPGHVAPAVVAGAALLLLIALTWFVRGETSLRPRSVAVRACQARGPPHLQTA